MPLNQYSILVLCGQPTVHQHLSTIEQVSLLWLIYIDGDGTRVRTQTRIPNPMTTLYYIENVHIGCTKTWISTPYFVIVQESESKLEPESVSAHVNKPCMGIPKTCS